MHITIKVKDLNLRQWDYLLSEVPAERTFITGIPRVCAEFELTAEISTVHLELDAVELVGLLVVLEGIKNEVAVADMAQAALTPDALPDYDPAFADRLQNGAYDR